jgi:hypothetical protein
VRQGRHRGRKGGGAFKGDAEAGAVRLKGGAEAEERALALKGQVRWGWVGEQSVPRPTKAINEQTSFV